MLKWILIVILGVVVLGIGTCYVGYKKLTEGGDTAVVTIATDVDRAWRYLSDADSMAVWQDETVRVWQSSDSAGLAVGDSMWNGRVRESGDGVTRDMDWSLVRMNAPTVLEWRSVDDSSGVTIMERVDSITTVGDSVRITIAFKAPMFTEMGQSDSVGGLTGKLLGSAGNFMAAAMRSTVEQHLIQLKALLETPVSAQD